MFSLREAVPEDIPVLHKIRVAVKENRLSDPTRIKPADYQLFLTQKGKGWVAEMDARVAGFAIIDTEDRNIWALFVDPGYEGLGMGRALHDRLLNWYFEQSDQPLWLSTAPGTRAERFYRRAGWTPAGTYGHYEIKFEMNAADWRSIGSQQKK